MSLENAKLQEWLQGLLACGVDSEGRVDQAIKSDINIRMLTDLAPTIIGTRTPDGELTYINSYWFWFTGCEDTVPEDINWQEYIHPDDLDNLLRINEDGFGTNLDFSFEFRLRRRDGQYRWFQSISRPVMDRENNHVSQWLTVSTPIQDLKDAQEEARRAREDMEHKVLERTRDLEEANERLLQEIEERQKTQDALRQAQKMESVGQLTGGIAHDFNNMLAVIMGNLELMKMSLANLGNNPTVQRIDRNVTMALEGALKAEKLTAQLLAFSRKARLHPERLNVNEVILGVREMVERAVGSSIVCEIDLEDDIWLCLSDKTQLESAIINLSINARDAMGRSGHLCIFSRNKTIGDQRFVSVSVKDDGAGMDAETLAKAFEPFFTTKDVGKGSGLGLSMVHGFCQQSNGKVFIESEVGKGTTVEMIFPYTAGAAIAETKADEDFNYDMNKRSVLVVEDEPGVRELACQLLTDLGYNVVSAEDGKSAIEILKDNSIPLDLLFTDVVMPGGVDGFSVAKVAAFERPSMPVIFTTGHAEVALRELKKDLSQKIKVIGKPYRIADLSSMIAAELNPR